MVIEQVISKYIKLIDIPVLKNKTIQFVFKKDISTGKNLCAIPVDSKRGSKIIINRSGYRVRTPSILMKYMGKKIIVYKDILEKNEGELFRIRSVDFSFEAKGRGVQFNRIPKFSKSGIFTVPIFYIHNYLDDWAGLLRLSLDRMNSVILESGEIHAIFKIQKDKRNWNYPLYRHCGGLRTRTLISFMNFINENNKNIEKFIYEGTYKDKYSKYGIMIFKEVI